MRALASDTYDVELMEYLSIVSLLIAIIALSFSIYSYREGTRADMRPVLVFSNAPFVPGKQTSWFVENVGKGPAVNVLLTGGNVRCEWNNDEWTLFPALSVGVHERLSEFSVRDAFIAIYQDALGNTYRTVCVGSRNTLARQGWGRTVEPKRGLRDLRRLQVAAGDPSRAT